MKDPHFAKHAPIAPAGVNESLADDRLRYGQDPVLDAWVLHFMLENNLDYLISPHVNASPEQLRFMVAVEEGEVYAPCSDAILNDLLRNELTEELAHGYRVAWRVFVRLVRDHVADRYTRRRIVTFAKHSYKEALAHHVLIPSRLTKRLSGIFLSQSGIDDPYRELKQRHNARVAAFMESPVLDAALQHCPSPTLACSRIGDLRWELDRLELSRLFMLSSMADIWRAESLPSAESLRDAMTLPAEQLEALERALGPEGPGGVRAGGKRILYIPHSSGAVLIDLLIIRSLLRQGHAVMLALKNGFYFQAPTLWDVECDPVLAKALGDARILPDSTMTKNELLKELREHRFLVISDGSRERLNLYRASVTFARAWKEADLVIGKGEPQYRRLIDTAQQFTRDVLCFKRDTHGAFHLSFKPKPEHVRKFTEGDLRAHADTIIHTMRHARNAGKQVVFYSAIIGSIPGQTRTAIQVVNTFVEALRRRFESAFIINPAEHFVPGMDGDDLMYMWERVQRSGLIDVWRFQTVADVEQSFDLMGKKTPAAWTGKDATFSTGCTKEMKIALEEQRRRPELQIIGPSPERFFRRREYGVGKFFDAGIEYL